jgi:hypothetical protein
MSDYQHIWLCLAKIKAKSGLSFSDLVDNEDNTDTQALVGAWANILIKAETISLAIEILPMGLAELDFDVDFIDKIENVAYLIENNLLNDLVIAEIKWLMESNFVFKISDKIFGFHNDL